MPDLERQEQQAARYCRMATPLRIVRGDVLAEEGQWLELAANKVSWGDPIAIVMKDPFIQQIKDCTPEQRAAYHQHWVKPMEALINSGWMNYPSGGRVFVRSHTRCNSNKCWPVRSYTRRR